MVKNVGDKDRGREGLKRVDSTHLAENTTAYPRNCRVRPQPVFYPSPPGRISVVDIINMKHIIISLYTYLGDLYYD
jgi:hypothetical protein